MKAIGNCFGVALLLLALAACTSKPIMNIHDVPIPSGHTPDQVQKAINAAGASLGWVMKDTQPGLIHGVLKLRTHEAEVDIAYSRPPATASPTQTASTSTTRRGTSTGPTTPG